MEERQTRPFADWLAEQAQGQTHAELSADLQDLVEAVTATGKGGALTLVVKVKPAGGERGAVVVTDEIKLKLPEADRPSSIWFADEDGNLRRDNPAQPRLPLREVPSNVDPETGELRDAQ